VANRSIADIEGVFLQSVDGQFMNANVFAAWTGCHERGLETRTFCYEDLEAGHLKLSRNWLVSGSVRSVLTALEQIGRPPPVIVDYPEGCAAFLGRRLSRSTLGEVRNMDWDTGSTPPVFVKPAQHHKAFTGHVISVYRDLLRTVSVPADTNIWVSDVVEFVSEWRVFVLKGRVVGCRPYKGDPLIFPDPGTILEIVASLEGMPIAFSVDVGTVASGETRLVECNDGFALGSYGLSSLVYTEFMLHRWVELTSDGCDR